MAAGRPDPGTPTVDKLEADVWSAYRRAEGLALTTAQAFAAVQTAMVSPDARSFRGALDSEAERLRAQVAEATVTFAQRSALNAVDRRRVWVGRARRYAEAPVDARDVEYAGSGAFW